MVLCILLRLQGPGLARRTPVQAPVSCIVAPRNGETTSAAFEAFSMIVLSLHLHCGPPGKRLLAAHTARLTCRAEIAVISLQVATINSTCTTTTFEALLVEGVCSNTHRYTIDATMAGRTERGWVLDFMAMFTEEAFAGTLLLSIIQEEAA